MRESQTSVPPVGRADSGQLRQALDLLEGLIADGLRHGFFEFTVNCVIGGGRKRELTIRAGKSHKFTIPEDEVSG
jgi:hypothetical protein